MREFKDLKIAVAGTGYIEAFPLLRCYLSITG